MATWSPEVIDAALREGDDLADRTVAAVVAERGLDGAIELLTSLVEQLGVPGDHPALDAYLAATGRPAGPPDPEAMRLAERMFEAHGWVFFGLLGCASLPEGYVVPDITRVLATTQQLTQHVHRRLWETIQFTLDVTQPGGLDAGGEGIRSIQKVRLLHATVRFLLTHEPPDDLHRHVPRHGYAVSLLRRPWDPDGELPLNQAYLAATVTGFSFVPLRGLERLGYDRVTRAEQEAYLARWNIVGELLGVRPDLLAWTMDDSQDLLDAVREPRKAHTPDGEALTAALVDFMTDEVPRWAAPMRAMPRLMIFSVCDPDTPALLGLTRTRWERLLGGPLLRVMRWWGGREDDLMRDLPPLAAGMRLVFNRLCRGMISRDRGWERGRFQVPPAMLARWGVDDPSDRAA